MATIKSFTDLEQSRKLAEILPLESADMHWLKDFDGSWFVDLAEYASVKIPKYVVNVEEHLLPCWSLAALIGVLPNYELNYSGDFIQLDVNLEALGTEGDETLLDLVVNMIIHLHELNLL